MASLASLASTSTTESLADVKAKLAALKQKLATTHVIVPPITTQSQAKADFAAKKSELLLLEKELLAGIQDQRSKEEVNNKPIMTPSAAPVATDIAAKELTKSVGDNATKSNNDLIPLAKSNFYTPGYSWAMPGSILVLGPNYSTTYPTEEDTELINSFLFDCHLPSKIVAFKYSGLSYDLMLDVLFLTNEDLVKRFKFTESELTIFNLIRNIDIRLIKEFHENSMKSRMKCRRQRRLDAKKKKRLRRSVTN